MTTASSTTRESGPWNPGIKSTLPSKYLPLSTVFRTENVFTSIETANELSDFSGLPVQQLVSFRPERLIDHELLIRVSADILISDGNRYEDLGLNFRKVVCTILENYIQPHLPQIVAAFVELQEQVTSLVENELSRDLFVQPESRASQQKTVNFISRVKSAFEKPQPRSTESVENRDHRLLQEWKSKPGSETDALKSAVFHSLAKVAGSIMAKHGRLIGEKPLLTSLVTNLVCNDFGSRKIGELISPYILDAVRNEGYTILPAQAKPIVINVKGASASGKSTMRPLQKKHTVKLGINWDEFALISPDIWRKYLLDYEALGEAYKYAGTLAGDEIPIVDQKLDHYIGSKAARGMLTHLLIDRFRFDSFASGADAGQGRNLLTRFGHTVYLNFMVTPPEATVERAWLRGLQVGRYKAVDDLLDHNIEAFKGMPVLFFTWALRKDKQVYYEFLDNAGPKGEKPKTIAFGFNGEMYIIDIKCMLDIERYTKINIDAHSPEQVYPSKADQDAAKNTGFLVNCARKIARLNFVDRDSGNIYAVFENATLQWMAADIMQYKLEDADTKAGFLALVPSLESDFDQLPLQQAESVPRQAKRHTLGELH